LLNRRDGREREEEGKKKNYPPEKSFQDSREVEDAQGIIKEE
jgi:hypothetical protein